VIHGSLFELEKAANHQSGKVLLYKRFAVPDLKKSYGRTAKPRGNEVHQMIVILKWELRFTYLFQIGSRFAPGQQGQRLTLKMDLVKMVGGGRSGDWRWRIRGDFVATQGGN